jgi:hypothetical protein
MTKRTKRWTAGLLVGAAVATVGALSARRALTSDHADTPEIAAAPGTDLTDVFVFPSATDPNKVVLAMCVSPLIPTGQASSRSFDPSVLYQFKIDNTGDNVEDLVIQARFTGTGPNQLVSFAGPAAPLVTGTQSRELPTLPVNSVVGQSFSPMEGMLAFAGPREDPFFFDLEQFFTILPDRATPVNGRPVSIADANKPQATSWRPAGQAKDFLAGLNVLAIVVEVPRAQLRGAGSGKIGVWCTTSK